MALDEAAHQVTGATFRSGSTDLAATVLGAPHHQVGEAASAVSEVLGQAPAHPAEDGAPQAGNEVLNTEHPGQQPPVVAQALRPSQGSRGRRTPWNPTGGNPRSSAESAFLGLSPFPARGKIRGP